MQLAALIQELLALGTPTAADVRRAIAGRDLTPAVHTINVRDDALGRGCYAELVVRDPARIRDLTPIVGELKPAPRTPADSTSGTKLATDVGTVHIVVELAPRSSDRIAYVTLNYKA
jgi:hypothetical protein